MSKIINDYANIERPYNRFLERSYNPLEESSEDPLNPKETTETSTVGAMSSENSIGNGSVETMPNKSDGSSGDVWIKNFIRSENWKPKKRGFYIDGGTGYAEFSNVYVSGQIEALTGLIGGFTIGANALYAGDNTTRIQLDTTQGIFLGSNTLATAPFSVTLAGALKSTSGTIGGCVISPTSLGSTLFVSGPLGSGWNISNTGTAEFQNVTIRGMIRTSVFEKNTISAINGIVMVSKADVLSADMTAADASTITISGETTFSENEVIRIKDGTDDEYMLVTNVASAPTYTVTRDLAGSYGANANPIWKKGTAVVSMGVGTGTKTGFVSIDSSSTNSPFIDVYGRNSNTYSDTTLHARLGWLKGITDADVGLASTDVWGLYTDNAYLKGTIVATAGKFGSLTNYWSVGSTGLTAVSGSADVIINYGKTDFGQDSTAGFILGYDYSASKPKFEIGSSATKIFKYDGTDFTLIGGEITAGVIQTSDSGARVIMNYNDSDYGITSGFVALDSSENLSYLQQTDGTFWHSKFTSYNSVGGMGGFYSRPQNSEKNFSSSDIFMGYQGVITDGTSYDVSGQVLLIAQYDAQTFGNATKTGSGSINLLRGFCVRSGTINYYAFDLAALNTKYDFSGINRDTSIKQYKIEIDGTGNPNTFKWSDDGGSTWVATGVAMTTGTHVLTSADYSTLNIRFSAITGGVSGDYWTMTSGCYSDLTWAAGLKISNEIKFNNGPVLHLTQFAETDTNFSKMIYFSGTGTPELYVSDGTTPNGNLTGQTGDICFGGDGGKAYYCTGGTSWTAM